MTERRDLGPSQSELSIPVARSLSVNTDKLFTRAVKALPNAVRDRLDADVPLDWTALERPETGAMLGEAARAHQRLPEPVEVLVNRLIGDVGIATSDLAAGAENVVSAGAWSRSVAVAAEGECYRVWNGSTGELHVGIRPEAVAGYVILALELATTVHEAAERWTQAGERHKAAAGADSSLVVLCAVRIFEHLQSHFEDVRERRTTAGVANALERAWNGQSLKTRASLSAVRLRVGRGVRAPLRRYYTPATSYRLHAFDPNEIRWLRALAEHAEIVVVEEEQEERVPENAAKEPAGTRTATAPEPEARSAEASPADFYALEARIRAANQDTGTLQFTRPDALVRDNELTELKVAANRISDAVRRRMRESYGIGFTQALSRLRSADDADALGAEISAVTAKQRAPRWLEELASTFLTDAGAQTSEGTRTTSIRLQYEEEGEAGYRAIEIETGAVGHLTPLGLIQQVRLGLTYSLDARRAHNALQNAGKESSWILDKGEAEGSEFSEDEREMLEAARRLELTLDRVRRTYDKPMPTALEEASMISDAFKSVGSAARNAAGWPATAEAPDPRDPEEIARVAFVAENLHEGIRAIANKFIAGWIAGTSNRSEANDHPTGQQSRETRPPHVDEAVHRTRTDLPRRADNTASDAHWRRP